MAELKGLSAAIRLNQVADGWNEVRVLKEFVNGLVHPEGGSGRSMWKG